MFSWDLDTQGLFLKEFSILKPCSHPKGMAVRSVCWGRGKAMQREGEREVSGRGRVTGPNSWAPAASVILRNKEAEKVI